jgi:hypothetical protein
MADAYRIWFYRVPGVAAKPIGDEGDAAFLGFEVRQARPGCPPSLWFQKTHRFWIDRAQFSPGNPGVFAPENAFASAVNEDIGIQSADHRDLVAVFVEVNG